MTDPTQQPVRIVPHKHPLNEQQQASLYALCDLMIPASPDGKMPSASSLKIYDNVGSLSEDDVKLFKDGLTSLEQGAQTSFSQSFAKLGSGNAQSVFDAIRPEIRRFAGLFTVQTAARYYSHDVVMPLIGLEARAPWPQGNTVEQGDWSLLDPVRKRAPMYRMPDPKD